MFGGVSSTPETLDIAFVLGRVLTFIVLVLSAVLARRLVSIYKGGTLQKSWLLLLTGILVFALAQLASASSLVFESDLFRIGAAVTGLDAGA